MLPEAAVASSAEETAAFSTPAGSQWIVYETVGAYKIGVGVTMIAPSVSFGTFGVFVDRNAVAVPVRLVADASVAQFSEALTLVFGGMPSIDDVSPDLIQHVQRNVKLENENYTARVRAQSLATRSAGGHVAAAADGASGLVDSNAATAGLPTRPNPRAKRGAQRTWNLQAPDASPAVLNPPPPSGGRALRPRWL